MTGRGDCGTGSAIYASIAAANTTRHCFVDFTLRYSWLERRKEERLEEGRDQDEDAPKGRASPAAGAVATSARLDLRAAHSLEKHRNMSRTTAQEVADAMEASHLSSASSDEAEETHGLSSGPSRAARARRSSLEDRRLPPPLSPRVAQDSVRALEGSAAGRSSSSAHGRLHPPSQLDATLRRSGPEDMSRSTSGGAMLRRCSTESAHSLDFDSDVRGTSRQAWHGTLCSPFDVDRCSPSRSVSALLPSLRARPSGHHCRA